MYNARASSVFKPCMKNYNAFGVFGLRFFCGFADHFKKLLPIAAAAVLLTGCGEKEASPDGYIRRIKAAGFAANYRDTESYLACWLPQEKQRFTEQGGCSEDFLTQAFAGAGSTGRMSFEVTDSEEMSEAQIEKLEAHARSVYGTRFDFTKARTANVEIRLNSAKEVLTDVRKLTVVRYEGGWYIFGEVIDSFSFAGS